MNKVNVFIIGCIFFTSLIASNRTFAADSIETALFSLTPAQKLTMPEPNASYNYEDTRKIPVRLRVVSEIPCETEVYEGQKVYFRVVSPVYDRGVKIIEKNTIVPARVETIIKSGMNGIPASIIFGSFEFPDINSSKFSDTFETYGQDRSLWVFPLKWALTPLPPTGSLTNFIKGGHAKLRTDEIIQIYYHPGWL